MEPSKVKERYQALKHQGPTRSLARCDSTDLLPQVIPQYVCFNIFFLNTFHSSEWGKYRADYDSNKSIIN